MSRFYVSMTDFSHLWRADVCAPNEWAARRKFYAHWPEALGVDYKVETIINMDAENVQEKKGDWQEGRTFKVKI